MPPAAVIVVLEPVHILDDPGATVIVGNAFTVMVRVAVFAQPLALVPVTVYVVVTVGDTVIVVPVVALNPVAGAQL